MKGEFIFRVLLIIVFFSFGFLSTFKTKKVAHLLWKNRAENKWFLLRQKAAGIVFMFISLVWLYILLG